ncbi:MAG: 3-hydroxyacyl-CoA dehydrogenase NAD-binding domain-containing protein [Terracidiphilus sp.]
MPVTVAIIGAGPLGRWLALAAARAGFRVLLEDVMPANLHHAQELLRQGLKSGMDIAADSARLKSCPDASCDAQELLRQEAGPPRQAQGRPSTAAAAATSAQDESMGEVAFVSTIEDAVRETDLVIDCVPDELESKLEILWLLDRMAPPRTVLATPTTHLSIADLAQCTYRPAKCIAIAAEASALTGNSAEGARGGAEILLRTTSNTAPETVALVREFWERLGFRPRFELDPAMG